MQLVKNLPASAGNAGDVGLSLGQEDPPEYKTATHSSILAWKILWTEEPGGLQSMGLQRVRHNLAIFTFQDSHIYTVTLIQGLPQ